MVKMATMIIMAKKNFVRIEDTFAYQFSREAARLVWNEVQNWDWVAKRTLGIQWIDSTDSISANLAEGFGRYHRKDRIKFYYNAKGSTLESIDWAKKALERKLISEEKATIILDLLEKIPREINFQIRYSMEKLKE